MTDENFYAPPSANLTPKAAGGRRMNLNYPLQVRFKLMALASQFTVTDAAGTVQMYVKQKAFKLKEDIRVFADDRQDNLLYQIKANKIIDFSASYQVLAADGKELGTREIGLVRRKGMRSLWKATYEVCRNGTPILIIQEGNPWIKLLDAVLGQFGLLGAFAGYFLNPEYHLRTSEGAPILMTAKKLKAFWEGKFELTRVGAIDPEDEELALMGLVVMLLLERMRG